MDKELLIYAAIDCGAAKAAILSAEAIVLDPVFNDICAKNQCGNYGNC